jgi:hypothetical protein
MGTQHWLVEREGHRCVVWEGVGLWVESGSWGELCEEMGDSWMTMLTAQKAGVRKSRKCGRSFMVTMRWSRLGETGVRRQHVRDGWRNRRHDVKCKDRNSKVGVRAVF